MFTFDLGKSSLAEKNKIKLKIIKLNQIKSKLKFLEQTPSVEDFEVCVES